MRPTLARRALQALIPPKIATPSSVTGGAIGSRMATVVDFYSKLPQGPAPASRMGIRRYFGKDMGGAPVMYTIFGILLFGYTLDYNMHLKHHKNRAH